VKPNDEDGNGWETNAIVRSADEYACAEGYRRAGRIVADYVIHERWVADLLVYPIVYLYRHHVELQLKRLIPAGAFLTGHDLNEQDRRDLRESHDLKQLWAIFEPILQKARDFVNIAPEDVMGMGSYVYQLHEHDPSSTNFRYTVTKSGLPSINNKKLPQINVGVLAEGMEKLANYLFGLGEAFHESMQLKYE